MEVEQLNTIRWLAQVSVVVDKCSSSNIHKLLFVVWFLWINSIKYNKNVYPTISVDSSCVVLCNCIHFCPNNGYDKCKQSRGFQCYWLAIKICRFVCCGLMSNISYIARTFGHHFLKRISFAMLPAAFVVGVITTLLAALTIVSMKGLGVGVRGKHWHLHTNPF